MIQQSRFITEKIEWATELWKQRGGRELFCRYGPAGLRIRFIAGALYEAFLPSFEHAESDPRESDPIVYVADSASLGCLPPPDHWPFPSTTSEHLRHAHWCPESGMALVTDIDRGLWHCFDQQQKMGLYWVRDGKNLPDWEYGSPLRIIIQWACALNEAQLVHAAAVEYEGKGVLLTGIGGSGKSTTTSTAVAAGYKTVGDDFVVMERKNNSWFAYPIYDSVKLTGMALDVLPDLAARAINPGKTGEEKARIHLAKAFPDRFPAEIEPRAIFSLRLGRCPRTTIRPITAGTAMMALAPSTLFLLRVGVTEGFRWLADLSRQLPCWEMVLGEDPFEAVETLSKFIQRKEK